MFKQNAAKILLTATLIIAGCSGGGDGASMPVDPSQTIDDEVQNPEHEGGLPDFSVIDLTVSKVDYLNLAAITTIANGGTAAAEVPDGWFLLSPDSSFTTNYQEFPVKLDPLDEFPGLIIEPGETRQFRLTSLSPMGDGALLTDGEVNVEPYKAGNHHVRLWINPDLGERFKNPEGQLMESHAVHELDYTNNQSPEVSYDNGLRPSSSDCTPDPYEENDAIDEATPIVLDTVYEFKACDDMTDVISIDLVAGKRYELQKVRTESTRGFWYLTIIDPDGYYLAHQSFSDSEIFDATVSGTYIIVTAKEGVVMLGSVSLEVIEK